MVLPKFSYKLISIARLYIMKRAGVILEKKPSSKNHDKLGCRSKREIMISYEEILF